MAASWKSKFSNRQEVQERFQINLESIINKYDKPFEDSPILDLQEMSSVTASLEGSSLFKPFGWTPLATDLQKGKKRKDGVSCDSALGSTMSPSKSNESTNEESSGNIYLENYDFTHETSDGLGAFIRYRHHSMSKNPEIVGLKRDGGEYDGSSDSGDDSGDDDDLGSVCSGPTYTAYPEEKYTKRIQNNQEDMIEVDRTRQTDGNLRGLSPQDKVRSWLSDDAFMNTSRYSNMDEDSEGDVSSTEMEELSQSTLSEGDLSQEDKTKSLLEIKERFVRKVKSILVEGNNETDDISSSADENGVFVQGVAVERTQVQNTSKNIDVSSSERERSSDPSVQSKPGGTGNTSRRLFKAPLSSTICHEASTARGNQDSKPVTLRGDETAIIAGHFDDDINLSECEDEDKAVSSGSSVQRCFELMQSPGGKMEWTSSHGRNNSAKKSFPFSTQHVKNKVEFHRGSQSPTCLTPKKTIQASDMSGRTFKKPQSNCNLPVKRHISKTTTESNEMSQGMLSEIMDFFKSPLPKLLTSPMPSLSPKGRLRTAQGKTVTRNAVSKSNDTGRTYPSTVIVQASSPLKSNGSQSAMMLREPLSKDSNTATEQSSISGVVTDERTDINQTSSKFSSDDTLNTPQGPHGVQEIHADPHSNEQSSNTEGEEDIVLLTADSSGESTTFQDQSMSRFNSVSRSPRTPSHLSHSSNEIVKVPTIHTPLSTATTTHEQVSKTPSITSPFSHMCVNSAEKDQLKVRHLREKGAGDKFPYPPKSLVFGESNPRDRLGNTPDMELLVLSSDEDENDGLNYEIEHMAGSPEMSKIKDISHQFSCTEPQQTKTIKSAPQVDSMEDESNAKEEIGSKCGGNHDYDSLEQLFNRRPEETVDSIHACNKLSQFEQTYIVSDNERKSSMPHHMSPSRNQIDRDRQRLKKNTLKSSSPVLQINLTKIEEEEIKSHQPKHKHSSSYETREENSSPNRRDGSRKAHRRSHCTTPVMTNKDTCNYKRQNEEHTANLLKNGCILQKRNYEPSHAKDRHSKTPAVRTSDHHHQSDRVPERSESTFIIHPGDRRAVPTKSGKGIHDGNEESSSPITEDIPSTVSEGSRLSATPRTKSSSVVRSNSVTSDKSKDKNRQKPIAKTAQVNDTSSHSHVRLTSSRQQKMLIQQDRVSTNRKGTKLHVRDESFLTSTRIDEDELNSKDLNRTLSSDRPMRKDHLTDKKLPKRVPQTHGAAIQDKSLKMKGQTPTKRRRRASDRASSLESPAKRQVSIRKSSQTGRTPLDRSKGSRIIIGISDDDIEAKERSDESMSSLSLSSICEGPGRCVKKICFKCAMNE
eukprot:XP_001197763.2 PREDICTED: uncharacterized protein LOC757268 [Strongylocentrotus purpuratus]